MVLTLNALGCGNGSAPVNGPQLTAPRTVGSLQLTASVPKTIYHPGETIPVRLTMQNVGTQPVTVLFWSGRSMDVVASGPSSAVWQASNYFGTTANERNLVFAPGQSATYETDWSEIRIDGSPAPAGYYTLTCWLTPAAINGNSIAADSQQATFSAAPLHVVIVDNPPSDAHGD